LGSPVVIVPRYPGVLSAMGLLAAPISVDLARTVLGAANPERALRTEWRSMKREALEGLEHQGVAAERLAFSADCRYRGQSHELEVEAPDGVATEVRGLAVAFAASHRQRYGYVHEGAEVEVVTVRLRAEGPPPELPSTP